MSVGFPPIIVYPAGLDDDSSLYRVFNTTETVLTANNPAWSEEILIDPHDPEIWADNGFATIEGELLYYDAVDKVDGKVYKLKRCLRNLGGRPTQYNSAGTWIRGFVVAEHHNQIVKAILKIQDFIGENFSEDEETLDWRIRNLQDQQLVFDDYACPNIEFNITTLSSSPNTGTLISYTAAILGGSGSFEIQFGDGTSSTQVSGTHQYFPNAIIDPVVIVSNGDCQVVQTPIARDNIEEPTVNPTVPPFSVQVPINVTIPQLSLTAQGVPSSDIAIAPIVFPCLDLDPLIAAIPSSFGIGDINIGDLPSVITFTPVLNIPSQITFSPDIDFPSVVTFINVPSFDNIGFENIPTIPAFIEFTNVPTFGVISFENIPVIPTLIEFGIAPEFPTLIEFGIAPEFPTLIEFGNIPSFPTEITFINVPSIPNEIRFVDVPTFAPIDFSLNLQLSLGEVTFGDFPSLGTIEFGELPYIPSIIEFGDFPSIPTFNFDNFPDIPSIITFDDFPDLPSVINFGDPNIPSRIDFGDHGIPSIIEFDCCEFPSIISFTEINIPNEIAFTNVPTFDDISFDVNVNLSLGTVNFGPAPTIEFGTAPSFPSIITFGSAPTIPDTINFGPAPSFAPILIEFGGSVYIPSTIELIGSIYIPSVIEFGAFPSLPLIEFGTPPVVSVDWGTPPLLSCDVIVTCPSSAPMGFGRPNPRNYFGQAFSNRDTGFENIEVEYDVVGFPSTLKLEIPEDFPREIKVVFPNAEDFVLQVASFSFPDIKIDTSNVSIPLTLPENFPVISFIGIPEFIQVVGMPDIIRIEHDIPSMIELTAKDLKVPLVFEGPPLSAELKINWNFDKIFDNIDSDLPCFSIVPCKK